VPSARPPVAESVPLHVISPVLRSCNWLLELGLMLEKNFEELHCGWRDLCATLVLGLQLLCRSEVCFSRPLKEYVHRCTGDAVSDLEVLPFLMDKLPLSVHQPQIWVDVVKLLLDELLPLPLLHPLFRAVAALQHRGDGLDGDLRVGELLLLPRLVEEVLCQPLEVVEGEVPQPLEVLVTQEAALLLPVLLLIKLFTGIRVDELPVSCSRDDFTLEVVNVLWGSDYLQLIGELQFLLCILGLGEAQ
jgi:hypothetical protein